MALRVHGPRERHSRMKTRLAAIALILVGVQPLLAIVGPSFGGSSSSKYITSTVTVVRQRQSWHRDSCREHCLRLQVRAWRISSARLPPHPARRLASSSSGSSVTWPVRRVCNVGQSVKKATSWPWHDSAAQLQLASVQATPPRPSRSWPRTRDPTRDQGQASNQLSQSKSSYSRPLPTGRITNQQNALP